MSDRRCVTRVVPAGRAKHSTAGTRRKIAFAVAALACASCAPVGPDYVAPISVAADVWNSPNPQTMDAGETTTGSTRAESSHADLARWWRVFDDPVLDDLVTRALAANTDVRAASARVRAARAVRSGTGAALFPTVEAGADYERRRSSGATVPGGSAHQSDQFSAGFDAGWEIDLFGGLRRARQQADATLAATDADLRDVLVTLLGEVARNYVEMRSLAERIAIGQSNAVSQAETLDIARWRFQAGLIGDLDVQQAEYNLANTRARIPTLETSLAAARNRIAVLLGLAPGSVDAQLAAARPIPVPPRDVAVGLPADLLRRRPDVEAAERRLAAATAAIGVATADLYPKLTLNGSLSIAATDVADLDSAAARGFSIGPSLRWNVFDAGRVRSVIAERSAAADETLAAYDSAVLTALEEAENALVALDREQVRRDHLAYGLVAARSAWELARLQYENGLVDFQVVLEANRALLGFEESLASSSAQVTTNLIALYKALGGGWEGLRCEGEGCTPPAG